MLKRHVRDNDTGSFLLWRRPRVAVAQAAGQVPTPTAPLTSAALLKLTGDSFTDTFLMQPV